MLWTEKYRPKSMTEIIGQDKFVRDARSWVVNGDMPNILLFGVAGTGKTAAAGALANDLLGDEKEENFFEINASDDRKLETVRTLIKEIASSSKIGDIPFRIILLDEMDGMTKDAQNALKRIMERYEANCRFIITCNERHRIIYPLQSRCANYNFTRLSDGKMELMLRIILDRENISHIELDELAPEICLSDLAGFVDECEIASYIDIDYSELDVCYSSLVEYLDYDVLADSISTDSDACREIADKVNAKVIASHVQDPWSMMVTPFEKEH